MFVGLMAMLVSLILAGTAAYFSVMGIVAIYPAIAIPAMIMGGGIEAGKLVATSWLYRNWKTSGFVLKYLLTILTIFVMFLTSMGIYGFLSKGHLESTSGLGETQVKLKIIDGKIENVNKKIASNQKMIDQMDRIVDKLSDKDSLVGRNGATGIRQRQQKERTKLEANIDILNAELDKLSTERIEINAKVEGVEKEIGPLKYIAELAYGSNDPSVIEKAVRMVTILLIIVFDPLAICLLLAANHSFAQRKKEKLGIIDEPKENKAFRFFFKFKREKENKTEPKPTEDTVVSEPVNDEIKTEEPKDTTVEPTSEEITTTEETKLNEEEPIKEEPQVEEKSDTLQKSEDIAKINDAIEQDSVKGDEHKILLKKLPVNGWIRNGKE